VVASRCETFGYAALEAMSAGAPVISTDWEGSTEIISDGVTGWSTPIGDAPALAKRIGWVLDHREEAAQVASAGQRRCRMAYSTEVVGPAMERFYRSTLDRAGRP
jgi:glycosyltransferase involved in cell wall biosynthesis